MSEPFNSHPNESNASHNSEAQQMLDSFWQREIDSIKNLAQVWHVSKMCGYRRR